MTTENKPKARMGRPPKGKNKFVKCYMTDETYKVIEEIAQITGQPLTGVLEGLVVDALPILLQTARAMGLARTNQTEALRMVKTQLDDAIAKASQLNLEI